MLGLSVTKNSLILGAFAAVTAGVIAITFQLTKERIAQSERAAAQKALYEIVPTSKHNNDLLNDTLTLSEKEINALGVSSESSIHLAKMNDELVAIIIPAVAPDGYSGDIKMIIGVNINGSVAGVRVLSHKETPGLGDKIDLNKADWILGFDNKSLESPKEKFWKVKKDGGDFDQFTGATITPRAVVNRVKTVLQYSQGKIQALQAETNKSD